MDARNMEQYKILQVEKARLEELIASKPGYEFIASKPGYELFITKMKLSVVISAMYSYEREIMDELKVTYLRQLISPDSLADSVLLEDKDENKS